MKQTELKIKELKEELKELKKNDSDHNSKDAHDSKDASELRKLEEEAEGFHEAGEYDVEWNAGTMASGIYLYRLMTDTFTETRKMVLMK